jgi:ATP-dependent Clp protease adaptor protein ClpS
MAQKKKQQQEGTGTGIGTKDRAREKVEPPKKYKIILHNDDYTPMEFVTAVLIDVFRMSFDKANAITKMVHEQGKGIAGVYPKEIAMMKIKRCHQHIKNHAHPLLITMEAE